MNLLKKLFSRKKEEAPDLPPEFHDASPPDWLLAAKGQNLRDGTTYSIRAQLIDSPRGGVADVVVWPPSDKEQPRAARTGLAKTEVDQLFVILGFSFPKDVGSIDPGSETGIPMTISVHRREPYATITAECDLASWVGTKKSGPPAIEMGRILWSARERAVPSRK